MLAHFAGGVDRHDQGHEHVSGNDVFQVHNEGGCGLQAQGDPGGYAVEQQRHGEHQKVKNGDHVLVVNETFALLGRCLVGRQLGALREMTRLRTLGSNLRSLPHKHRKEWLVII